MHLIKGGGKVFTRKKKVEGNLGAVKPEDRLLRLFRSNDASRSSPIGLEENDRKDDFSGNQKIIGTAMLEAQYQSGKALLAFESNRRFC
jgi:hypothetical protein